MLSTGTRAGVVGIVAMFTLAIFGIAALANTIISVNEDNLGVDWFFAAETGSGSGEFVAGPGDPPIGSGSAEISISAVGDGFVLAGFVGLGGTLLADIEALSYSTYRTTGNSAWALSLQFAADYNGTGAWQGRLVFEPHYTETVNANEWQTWDTLTQGKWWGTGGDGAVQCPINAPCTWSEVLVKWPEIEIRDDGGPIVFKAGSGWGEFRGNVDGFSRTIAGDTKTYDFGPKPADSEPEPATRADCMNGGWEDFGFKNQGHCIRYVNGGG